MRIGILAALVFSGLTALVYQIIWTRLLGFAFGTTTEAISTVLAIFFGGLALGNLVAARALHRVRRPMAVYAGLEAAIGAWALLSLPLLQRLDTIFVSFGGSQGEAAASAVRVLVSALILLPPTIAMGATLPVVAQAFVEDDARIGRGSAQIYAANTFGAVLGAYLSGFWLIPFLGLSRAVWLSGAVNLLVAAGVAAVAAGWRVPPLLPRGGDGPGDRSPRHRAVFLACFGISGFVAIGYEIVWSKVFGVVMEGTLYGFATVLSAFLLGIGAGSLAVSRVVDRIRDLPRAFALLHVAIGVAVVVGSAAIPYLPYLYARLAEVAPGGDAVHLLYLVALPVVLLPTLLFGAAFPVLVRIDAAHAGEAGRSVGLATAVNTAGSIAASLLVGFWWIPAIGMDGSLYALLMIDFAAAIALLWGFQQTRGPERLRTLVAATAVVALASLSYGGVHVEEAVVGRRVHADDLPTYLERLEEEGSRRAITIEGKSSIVSVYATKWSRAMHTNGLSEAGVRLAQPYAPIETVLLGLWPYLLSEHAERGLVIGLGGGNTVDALLETDLRSIDVIEIEREVVRAVALLHEGRPDPLADPRVDLRIADGRHDLLLRTHRGDAKYDLIASQPSHPWRVGAANLFTEEFFGIARGALRDGGVFAAWLNGFRIDAESLLAVVGSFERVFPGSVVVDVSKLGRVSFLLVGSTRPLVLDLDRMRERLAEPRLAGFLEPYPIDGIADLLARIEGPASAFAALDPSLRNTDDNALVETRTPRQLDWQELDFAAVEDRLPRDTALLPPVAGALDPGALAVSLFERPAKAAMWPYRPLLERLLVQHADAIPDWDAAVLRERAKLFDPSLEAAALDALVALAADAPDRPEAHRAIGHHLATRRAAWREAAAAYAAAFARSRQAGDAYDAGRALHPVDPAAAWTWFSRIPVRERADHPRLAFYEAHRALAVGDDAALPALWPRLLDWLASDAGRRYPGGHEVASRVAFRLGRPADARAHADADAALRALLAEAELEQARAALASGRLERAETAIGRAAMLLPASEEVALLRADLAVARRDAPALTTALAALRRFAPSVDQANAVENDFRTRHGMPLRPEAGALTP